MNLDPHQKQFVKLARELSSNGRSDVMRDFCEMAALSLANFMHLDTGGLLNHFASKEQIDREKRYKEIATQYSKEDWSKFPHMLSCVVNSLTDEKGDFNFHDCLGELHMTDEITGKSKWDSDVAFTPFHITHMMGLMTFGSMKMPEKGYISVGEPAAGAGSMIIGACAAMKELGFNFQKQLHVVATEIRPMLVHMCYIQLSLLHVPAIVIHGNSLSQEVWSEWKTPAHILGFWDVRLRRDAVAQPVTEKQIQLGQTSFGFGDSNEKAAAGQKGNREAGEHEAERPPAQRVRRQPPRRHRRAG